MRRLLCVLAAMFGTVAWMASSAEAGPRLASTPGVRIAAVGDMVCKNPPGRNPHVCRYDRVSDVVAAGTYQAFLPLGDNQYEAGSYADYVANYDPYFGRFLPITYPVPGNA